MDGDLYVGTYKIGKKKLEEFSHLRYMASVADSIGSELMCVAELYDIRRGMDRFHDWIYEVAKADLIRCGFDEHRGDEFKLWIPYDPPESVMMHMTVGDARLPENQSGFKSR
jgi:hypothetical protein